MTGNITMAGAQTVDGVDISTHAANPSAHHPAEIPDGRVIYGSTIFASIPGVELSTQSTISLPTNYIHYFPIKIVTPVTYDRMIVEVTTAASAGKKLRLAIYNANINWQPTSLILDAGEVAADTNAVVTKTINQTLTPGPYLLAIAIQETTVLRALRGGSRYTGVFPTLGATSILQAAYVSKAYAAFSDPGTSWNAVWAGILPFSHALFLRASVP